MPRIGDRNGRISVDTARVLMIRMAGAEAVAAAGLQRYRGPAQMARGSDRRRKIARGPSRAPLQLRPRANSPYGGDRDFRMRPLALGSGPHGAHGRRASTSGAISRRTWDGWRTRVDIGRFFAAWGARQSRNNDCRPIVRMEGGPASRRQGRLVALKYVLNLRGESRLCVSPRNFIDTSPIDVTALSEHQISPIVAAYRY